MQNDEVPLRRVLIALIIAAITIAIFFFPMPSASAPQVELKPEHHFVETVEAKGIATVEDSKPELVAPLMRVCSCESTGSPENEPQHFEKDGVTVLLGKHNPRDVGMCQINLDAHEKTAITMGLDLFKMDDNIRYANWLFSKQGLKPWRYSKTCWQ